MFQSIPFLNHAPVTPTDVAAYLRDNGWYVDSVNPLHGDLWVKLTGRDGYFTWEQALSYSMWKRLHLGAV